jgi:hypothetical protein
VSAERSSMPVKAQIGSRPCALNFNLPKGLRVGDLSPTSLLLAALRFALIANAPHRTVAT